MFRVKSSESIDAGELKSLAILGSERNPDFPDVHRSLGIFYQTQPGYVDMAKALEHYRRFVELTGDERERLEVKAWIQEIEVQMAQGGGAR